MKKNYQKKNKTHHRSRMNNAPRQRKSSRASTAKPWSWLVIGVVLGMIIPGVVLIKSHHLERGDKSVESQILALEEKPIAKKHRPPVHKQARNPSSPAKETKQYEFYDMLSNGEESGITPNEASPTDNDDVKKSYVLQIASFKTFSEADRLKAELIVMGYDVFISKTKQNNINWNRVNVGPFDSLAKIQATQKDLRAHHIDSIIVPIK